MYIKFPNGKEDRILMLRALATSITANSNHPFDVVTPTEYQSTMSLFEEKYTAYKVAKKTSETSRQSRDLLIKDIEISVVKIAQYLKVKFYGNEKAIADWGFSVRLGKRSGIIARDRKAESNIELYEQIIAKHTADGENSILNSYDMASFEGKVNQLKDVHSSFKENRTLTRIYAKQHQKLLKELMAMARKIARNLRMREDMEPKDLESFGFSVLESYASARLDNSNENKPDEDVEQAS